MEIKEKNQDIQSIITICSHLVNSQVKHQSIYLIIRNFVSHPHSSWRWWWWSSPSSPTPSIRTTTRTLLFIASCDLSNIWMKTHFIWLYDARRNSQSQHHQQEMSWWLSKMGVMWMSMRVCLMSMSTPNDWYKMIRVELDSSNWWA